MAMIASITSLFRGCHIAVRSANTEYNSPKGVSSSNSLTNRSEEILFQSEVGPMKTQDYRKIPLQELASKSCDEALAIFGSKGGGLSDDEVSDRLKKHGRNLLSTKRPPRWWQLVLRAFLDYFNILLLIIAIISVAVPGPEWAQFAVIMGIICLSCVVRLWEESRSAAAVIKLLDAISTDVRVMRQKSGLGSVEGVIDERGLVPGDIMLIDQGNIIPADCLIISAIDLSISQSSLTGESEPQRKTVLPRKNKPYEAILELQNIAFMGTNVISGSGWGLVLKTGDDAFIATIMMELNKKRLLNAFQRGIRSISIMMTVVITILFPIVLVVNGFVKHNWIEAVTFSLSVAVGLLPSMLPAIVNANLARGAFTLGKKNAVVKSLDSVQCLGAMSVLCSDKTGTLTKDEINLCQYLNPLGVETLEVYDLAHTNARYQSGKKNSVDSAILKHAASEKVKVAQNKLGEIPFSFEARRSSCIILDDNGDIKVICKGAFEEVVARCESIRLDGKIVYLDGKKRRELTHRVNAFNSDGYRVILVATKALPRVPMGVPVPNDYGGLDQDMTVEGLLTFLDPPKDDAKASISRLQELGVDVRCLTGDNLGVAVKVCRDLNLVKDADDQHIQAITGPELAKLGDTDEFHKTVKHCRVFAKLTPVQKGQVVDSLKNRHGKVVGMLGDGINDCIALRAADAGISVHTGQNVAKECADIILVKKDLSIIVDCILTGRITMGNTIKYIKMGFSANLGNIMSILVSSAWLPFPPMTSLQILLSNILYETSQLTMPWDNVDTSYLATPQVWSIFDLLRFSLILGPLSCTLDIATFIINWFWYHYRDPAKPIDVAKFQTHWFLQNLVTATLVVHLLRTETFSLSFKSRPATSVVLSTLGIMAIGIVMLYIKPLANVLEMAKPDVTFWGWLTMEMGYYVVAVEGVKWCYVKWFGRWL